MTLIDRTYFIGEINIPNKDSSLVSGTLDAFIKKYEPLFLKYALGYNTSQEFIAALATPSPAQKWVDLRDGKEYSLNGYNYFWPGLKNTERNPIAYYVYYWYMRNQVSSTAGLGEVKPAAENAAAANSSWRMAQAWNACSLLVDELNQYLLANAAVYTEWNSSLDPYPAVKYFRHINSFGI